jgi:aspartyl-tRNA synthetase
LTSFNKDVHLINEEAIKMATGKTRTHHSQDSNTDEYETNQFTIKKKELNLLNPSGEPPFKIKLKVGTLVTLTTNTSRDLANGTRLIIKSMHENTTHAQVT